MKRLLRRLQSALLDPFIRLPLGLAFAILGGACTAFGYLSLALLCFLLNDLAGIPSTRRKQPHRLPILYGLIATEACAVAMPNLPTLLVVLVLSVWFYFGDSDTPPPDDHKREKVRKEQLKWTPEGV